FCYWSNTRGHHRYLHSFPTRRSSDLESAKNALDWRGIAINDAKRRQVVRAQLRAGRLSTAVEFCGAATILQRSDEVADLKTAFRSEEHTSELQSRENLVCRLLLEKKK